MSDLAVLADDGRSFDAGVWRYAYAVVHPDVFFDLLELAFIEFSDQVLDKVFDLRESLPGIFIFFQIFSGNCVF